mmetsp:Transcript_24985/g.54779  ORF Transcript_24985/g.54779 Transcript_24985/m.54779 type:complete len:575 (-) Transcript_24985:220-1944(-)
MSAGSLTYQIDFSAIAAGKRVSSSKRKIRWRFGFANQRALANGLHGTECRGDEHDVTIVWSVTSGKRQIMMDGKEIHYSTNRAGVLDFSWQTKGNHVIKVTCHAAPPMSAQPDFRQYDLSIDGQSFFTMPKVFQVGIKGAVNDSVPGAFRGRGNQSGMQSRPSFQNLKSDAPLTREQEDVDLHRAIEASINESRRHLGEIPSRNPPRAAAGRNTQNGDLLGFGGPSAPQTAAAYPPSDARSVTSFYTAPPAYNQGLQSPPPPTYQPPAPAPRSDAYGAIVPAVAPAGYYQAQPPVAAPAYASPAPAPPQYASPAPPAYASPSPQQQAAFSSPPPPPPAPSTTPVGDVFGLHMAPVHDPFAPRPAPPATHEDLASAVMGAYQSPPAGPAAPQTPMAERYVTTPATPQAIGTNGDVGALSMNTLTITATAEGKPKSEFEKALCNLVNVDHIDEPAEGEVKLTMMKKEENQKQIMGKSVPKPPSGLGMVGSNAPLSQIQRDFKSPRNNSSEGIMSAPPPGAFSPHAAHSGALVVHGQGPPPLQQAQGFGIGARLPNGGFQNQQNLAPGQYVQQQNYQ